MIVTVQRQVGAGWRVALRVQTTAQGRYVAAMDPVPGTYRARVLTKGLAPGFSRPVAVS
jgi:hypothetical protein